MKPLLASLACLASGVGVGLDQVVFREANRTVAVYATVTDANGRLVTDLEQSAFTVEDNGKRQRLTIFANDIQPITVVMLLDRSTSMRGNSDLVRDAAEEFVARLQPRDRARIGSFADRVQVDPRDFTSDRDELLAILRDELQEEGPTPLWNAVNVGITALLHQEGRRVVLVFTDGVDAPLNITPHNSTLKSVMKRAVEENVMVYAVGLASVGWRGGPGRNRGARRGPGRAPGPDPGLAKLATETGGGHFELTSTANLASTFARVAEELHHQYLLGFSPTVFDGKTHRIGVTVPDRSQSVRARKTYVAAIER